MSRWRALQVVRGIALEQREHFAMQARVVPAGSREKRGTLLRTTLEGVLAESLDLPPAFGRHGANELMILYPGGYVLSAGARGQRGCGIPSGKKYKSYPSIAPRGLDSARQ